MFEIEAAKITALHPLLGCHMFRDHIAPVDTDAAFKRVGQQFPFARIFRPDGDTGPACRPRQLQALNAPNAGRDYWVGRRALDGEEFGAVDARITGQDALEASGKLCLLSSQRIPFGTTGQLG